MSARKLTIGEVACFPAGEPINWGSSMVGDERIRALQALYLRFLGFNNNARAYIYYALNPARIVRPEDVDWDTAGARVRAVIP
jgi:hypothetical protein